MTEIKTHECEWTDSALGNLNNMLNHLHKIKAYCGDNSEYYIKAVESFAYSIAQVTRLGGKIQAEDEMSLFCWNDHISYGMIFHRKEITIDDTYTIVVGEWSVHS